MIPLLVDVMTTSEVGDDRAGRRHEQDQSGTVARDDAAHDGHLLPPSLWTARGIMFMSCPSVCACAGLCEAAPPGECQHGGYQDPNNCARCVCPDGYGGQFCTQLEPATGGE